MTEEERIPEAPSTAENSKRRKIFIDTIGFLGFSFILLAALVTFAIKHKSGYLNDMTLAEEDLSESILEGPSDWLSYADYTSAARVELGSEVVSAVLVSTPKTNIHAQGLVCVATRSGDVRPTVVRSSARFEEDLKGPYLDSLHDISDFTKDELTSFCGELLQESSSYLHQMR